jgi:hypothetical protein
VYTAFVFVPLILICFVCFFEQSSEWRYLSTDKPVILFLGDLPFIRHDTLHVPFRVYCKEMWRKLVCNVQFEMHCKFWLLGVASCSLVGGWQRFGGIYCFHLQGQGGH